MKNPSYWFLPVLCAIVLSGACSSGTDVAQKVGELRGKDPGRVYSLAFNPDGTRLAVDTDDQNITVWDWRSQRVERTIAKAHGANPRIGNTLTYSPNGLFLASCESKGLGDVVVRIWRTDTWSVAKDVIDSGPGFCVAIAFAPDGQRFYHVMYRGGGGGDTVVATNVASWKEEWGLRLDDAFEPESAAINPEGRLLVVSGLLRVTPPHPRALSLAEELKQTHLEERDYILDLTNQKVVRTFESPARDVVEWSPGDTHIALAGQQYVEVFNAHSGQREVQTHDTDAGHGNIRYTPDGRYFVESDLRGRSTGSNVKIWDAAHSKLLQKIDGDAGSLAVSGHGRYLAVGGLGGTTIWRFK